MKYQILNAAILVLLRSKSRKLEIRLKSAANTTVIANVNVAYQPISAVHRGTEIAPVTRPMNIAKWF